MVSTLVFIRFYCLAFLPPGLTISPLFEFILVTVLSFVQLFLVFVESFYSDENFYEKLLCPTYKLDYLEKSMVEFC